MHFAVQTTQEPLQVAVRRRPYLRLALRENNTVKLNAVNKIMSGSIKQRQDATLYV